ncbi:hypothetical protein MKX03_024096, partial [Papaver bracteatum]
HFKVEGHKSLIERPSSLTTGFLCHHRKIHGKVQKVTIPGAQDTIEMVNLGGCSMYVCRLQLHLKIMEDGYVVIAPYGIGIYPVITELRAGNDKVGVNCGNVAYVTKLFFCSNHSSEQDPPPNPPPPTTTTTIIISGSNYGSCECL